MFMVLRDILYYNQIYHDSDILKILEMIYLCKNKSVRSDRNFVELSLLKGRGYKVLKNSETIVNKGKQEQKVTKDTDSLHTYIVMISDEILVKICYNVYTEQEGY